MLGSGETQSLIGLGKSQSGNDASLPAGDAHLGISEHLGKRMGEFAAASEIPQQVGNKIVMGDDVSSQVGKIPISMGRQTRRVGLLEEDAGNAPIV